MFGFAMRVSVSDIFQIEERAIYEGLFLAWQKGFRKVVIKSDNALLVDLIGNGYAADSNISEWRLIYDLCKKDWQLKFQHVPRDHNRLADCMDKVANSELNRLSLFDVIPTHARFVFEDDLHQLSIVIGL
ncbi:hypothetical protein Godav_017624 [Gossypium davidsonii]|uniref:RNase H type-1 domain-containing protein n=2 Tax=Gossypium TaxID=3633 RepID=A0A7J8QU05_GOSDV|nr:hypothetical protein [Gossypium davidsonii]MBA0639893.1 hypothetical protein [Gossypium klotzschianum]